MEIRRIRDRAELDAALALRDEVFIREQGVSPAGDVDGRDEEAVQIVAVDGDRGVVGTCRVLVDGPRARFGRLCVHRHFRRQGIAAALLAHAEDAARDAGCHEIGLHAQADALELYLAAGYRPYGQPFDEEGIEHLGMEKELTGA